MKQASAFRPVVTKPADTAKTRLGGAAAAAEAAPTVTLEYKEIAMETDWARAQWRLNGTPETFGHQSSGAGPSLGPICKRYYVRQ